MGAEETPRPQIDDGLGPSGGNRFLPKLALPRETKCSHILRCEQAKRTKDARNSTPKQEASVDFWRRDMTISGNDAGIRNNSRARSSLSYENQTGIKGLLIYAIGVCARSSNERTPVEHQSLRLSGALGLKLESTKGPVETLVIDHAKKGSQRQTRTTHQTTLSDDRDVLSVPFARAIAVTANLRNSSKRCLFAGGRR